MPALSKKKKDKISEQLLHYLFSISPIAQFTSKISEEIARDEEFTKSLLINLKSKSLVVEINKNAEGTSYIRRQRWRLSNQAYDFYKKHQSNQLNTSSTALS
jgi:hypothetical protein